MKKNNLLSSYFHVHGTARRKNNSKSFSANGFHQNMIDRKEHSKAEFRYRDLYGKWPAGMEMRQVEREINRKPEEEEK